MFECLAIIQFICLAGADTISFSPTSLSHTARVRFGEAELLITLRSDSPMRLVPEQMERACLGENCVTYARRCDTEPARIRCAYAIFGRWSVPALELSAPNRLSFAQAEHQIRVEAGSGVWIPLAALDRTRQGDWPFCQRAPRQPPCPEGGDRSRPGATRR
jgi:hypothetical protein